MSKHGYTEKFKGANHSFATSTDKARALCDAIYSKACIAGYVVDMDPCSGGIGIFADDGNPDQTLAVYATPFWEGDEGIGFQVVNDSGHILHDLVINQVPWTGDIEKDIDVWKAAVAPLLAVYLPFAGK